MIIKNGKILLKDGVENLDLRIEGEKIVEIGKNLQGDKILDIENSYIVPGGIDPHTHFNINVGIDSADTFKSGSFAALMGGTTTVIDHPGFGPKGCRLDYMINKYHKYGKSSYVDYLLHGVAQEFDEFTEEGLRSLKEQGINSFKIYLTYTYRQTDEEILKFFEVAKKLDMVVAVHAENHAMLEYLKNKFKKTNKLSPIYHAYSRPGIVEGEAVNRLIQLADLIGFSKLYLVHISSKEAIEQIELAKKKGKKFYVETCPQYLYLTEDKYLEENGEKYILSPPLRKEEDIDIIWKAIKNQKIDTIGTDHCSFSLENKSLGKDDFTLCPNGIPGVEERITLLFNEFLNGKLTAKEYLELNSLNSARIFGIDSKKGSIDVGKDADLIIFSKEKNRIEEKNLHTNARYSCYQGFEVQGKIDKVILRGEVVVENGKYIGNKNKGKFLGQN